MFEKGVPVTIDGTEHNLVFTTAAMLEIYDKFGSVEEMAGQLTGPEADQADTQEDREQKAVAAREAKKKALRETPWLISLLANQGLMLKTSNTSPTNPNLITPAYVALHTSPKELMALLNYAMDAIAVGTGTVHKESGDKEVDVLLEGIQKNAAGATA